MESYSKYAHSKYLKNIVTLQYSICAA